MEKLIALCACAALAPGAAGCGEEEPRPRATARSATTAETGSARPAPPDPPRRLPTAQDRVDAYRKCFAAASAREWEAFGACYVENAEGHFAGGDEPVKGRGAIVGKGPRRFADAMPDLTFEPQLILQNGDLIAAVLYLEGTHTAPFMGPTGEIPATKKKVGLHAFHMARFARDRLELVEDWHFIDSGTVLGQLGVHDGPHRPAIERGTAAEPVVVMARQDGNEKKNLAAFRRSHEAWQKHDAGAMLEFWADDARMIDAAMPGESSKKQAARFLRDMLRGFPDAGGQLIESWAAGDYVVALTRTTGTNTGPMPAMNIAKPTGRTIDYTEASVIEMKGGKGRRGWSFYDAMTIGAQLAR
jgi:predicted ester cyclase